jgi:hypothetical protein
MSGGNSGVESLPSKQMVAGSNPVPRSIVRRKRLSGLQQQRTLERRRRPPRLESAAQLPKRG